MELPSFFSSSLVDDSKYESLLADLRAHDLLGTDDDFKTPTGLFPTTDGIFSGDFVDTTAPGNRTAPPPNVKAPPGFDSSDRGLAPTVAGPSTCF